MIEKFPQLPDDQEKFFFCGHEYTYYAKQNSWRTFEPEIHPDTGIDSIDISLYNTIHIGSSRNVVVPRGSMEEFSVWEQIRDQRDRRIREIEWRYNRYDRQIRLGLPTTDSISALDNYVQALADITTQTDPYNISWPNLNESN